MSEISPSPDLSVPAAPSRRKIREATPLPPVVLVLLLTLFFGFGVGTGYMVWGRPLAAAQLQLSQAASGGAVDISQNVDANGVHQVTRYPVSEDDDPVYGPDNAPITIIEFSDFQCPYCLQWENEIWPQLKEQYPDQIRLVYRDFPLTGHPEALPAALAADCANAQGKFWEYHDLLFDGGLTLGREAFDTYAQQIGLNMSDFDKCLDDQTFSAEVQGDVTYATQLGVQATPTFFLNGIALVGAMPFENFKQVIDLELAGKLSK
jgi:protein-disulfide isomerase